MYYIAKKYLPCITIVILIANVNLFHGKRFRVRDKDENKSKGVSNTRSDICISGHCIDSTYNKLELPSSKPSHIRLNLEVIR